MLNDEWLYQEVTGLQEAQQELTGEFSTLPPEKYTGRISDKIWIFYQRAGHL